MLPHKAGVWRRRPVFLSGPVMTLEVFDYQGVEVYYVPGSKRQSWREFGWTDRWLYRYTFVKSRDFPLPSCA